MVDNGTGKMGCSRPTVEVELDFVHDDFRGFSISLKQNRCL